MNFIKKLKTLFKLTSFKVGLLLTLINFWGAINYYSLLPEEMEHHLFHGTFDILQKKTLDLKMKIRGPRPPSPEVVLVTVDEESLNKVGRWVWPRNIFADLLRNLSEDQVSAIALDVIFSEPEVSNGLEPLNKILKQNKDPQLKKTILTSISSLDNDQKLADVVEKYQDQIILGSYFTDENYYQESHLDLCYNELYKRTQSYKTLSTYDYPIGVLDGSFTSSNEIFVELPSIIKKFLGRVFDKIEQDTLKSVNSDKLNLEESVFNNQSLFCSQFLNSPTQKDLFQKNWSHFQEQEPALATITLEDWIFGVRTQNLKNPIQGASDYFVNIPSISKVASWTASFRAFLDQDGVIRKSKLVSRYGDLVIPSIALAAFLQAKQYSVMIDIQKDPSLSQAKIIQNFNFFDSESGELAQKFPIDPYSSIIINYAGPRNSFPYISASEILKDSKDIQVYQADPNQEGSPIVKSFVSREEYLKDKIVLIGATATGIYDLRVSPLDSDFPGLEIHANILDNLLQNNMYRPFFVTWIHTSSLPLYIQSLWDSSLSPEELLKIKKTPFPESFYMPLLLLLLGILFSYIISHVGALMGLSSLILISSFFVFTDYFLLFKNHYVITVIFPVFLLFFIYVSLTFFKYLTEERTKKELKGTFQKYVSPSIVTEILSHPEKVELGGKKARISVLFSDIRGFTSFSEKLDPQVLGDFLNLYLTPMTEIVFKNKGTLDKYMGDAIMAFFGAPIFYENHALKSCQAALEMLDSLSLLNQEFKNKKLPQINIGIGINTGEMSVGNMGSEIVRSYTVMGDSVNLASRLEGINKNYGSRIIISEFTYEDVKDQLFCRSLDLVQVKGKAHPVKIYELLSSLPPDLPMEKAINTFEEGYLLYHQKNFNLALEKFRSVLELLPEDSPSQLYIQRCQDYLQSPPPEDWNGVYEFQTK